MQVLAPLRTRGQVIRHPGVDARQASVGDEDAWRLGTVADQMATAIQNARYDAMRDYAIEREQQAIERLAELEREREAPRDDRRDG